LNAPIGAESESLQVVALPQTAKPGVTERQDARLALQSTALEARLRLNSPQLKTVSFAHYAPAISPRRYFAAKTQSRVSSSNPPGFARVDLELRFPRLVGGPTLSS